MISMNFIEISEKTPYVVIGVAAVAAEVGVGFIVQQLEKAFQLLRS